MDKSQRMQGLALIVLLAIFFAGLFSVSAAPVFSLLCLTCLGALFVFVKAEPFSTENSYSAASVT